MAFKLKRGQIGDAGEYAAAAELAVRGWMVDLPRRGAREIDLYAQSPTGGRTCGIQVKTRTRGDFDLGDRLMVPVEQTADEWVMLVTLASPGERSAFHVVPRNHVAAAMIAYAGNRKDGGRGWTRKFFGDDVFGPYAERWDLVERPAVEAAWLMPDWIEWDLDKQGRDDIFALVPQAPRPSR